MEILLAWVFFSALVGIAANARGRSFIVWLLLGCVISPLLALFLVLVMRDLRTEKALLEIANKGMVRSPTYLNPTRMIDPRAEPKSRLFFGKASRITIDRSAFEPDGVYAGIPYKVTANGAIDAVMQGKIVRFADFERFTGAVGSPGSTA